MRASIVLAVMCSFAAHAAAVDPSIKGCSLHQTKVDFLQNHPDAKCYTSACTFHDSIGGAFGEFSLSFDDNDQVESIDITLQPDSFDGAMSALKGKFGKPVTDQRGTVANGFGAKFDDQIYVWVGKGWKLQARKRAGKVTESMINMFTREHEKRIDANAKGKPDDI